MLAIDQHICLGVDPTTSAAMGWAVVRGSSIMAVGSARISSMPVTFCMGIPDRVRARAWQALCLEQLIEQHAPDVIAVEDPVLNAGMIDRYASDSRKAAGAMRSSIELGMTVGQLEQVVIRAGRAWMAVNPGAAKYEATGTIIATKAAMRAAARLRLAEGGEYNQVRLPSEHEADALFIALVGARLYRAQQWMQAAS